MLELKVESPWDVKSILEFQYFNCPTCPDKYGLKQDFINHATKIHPESIDYLKKISDGSFIPWSSNEYESDAYNETTNRKVKIEIEEERDNFMELQDSSNYSNGDDEENGNIDEYQIHEEIDLKTEENENYYKENIDDDLKDSKIGNKEKEYGTK